MGTLSDAAELTRETVDLLKRGAANQFGIVCTPGEVRKLWPQIHEAEQRNFIRFVGGIDRPWITPEGRAAIGAPTEAQADLARRNAMLAPLVTRKRLKPEKRRDVRTDFDYRSFKAMGYVCVLAVRAPDDRTNPRSIKVEIPGSFKPEGFGPGNSIVQPECVGTPFVLACIPSWLQRRLKLPMGALPLPDHERRWTDDDRATWDRLRQVCHSINSRIRNANRGERQKLRFGETA